MKVEFRRSFVDDLDDIRDKELLRRVRATIEALEQADSLADVRGVKQLRGEERYYRVRLGDYRLGFAAEGDQVTLVRFLHRRDIYRYFPQLRRGDQCRLDVDEGRVKAKKIGGDYRISKMTLDDFLNS